MFVLSPVTGVFGPWVCPLGLHDVGWASRRPLRPSTFHGGGVAVLLCSSQKAVSRLRCCLGGGDHLPSLLPLINTKGDDAADTEESELGSRASGFQKKRRRRPKELDPPLLVGHPPDTRAVRPTSPIAWADGGPSCEVYPLCAVVTVASLPQDRHAHQHFSIFLHNEGITRAGPWTARCSL